MPRVGDRVRVLIPDWFKAEDPIAEYGVIENHAGDDIAWPWEILLDDGQKWVADDDEIEPVIE